MENELRTEPAKTMLTPSELEALDELARLARRSRSDYIRLVLLRAIEDGARP